MDIGEKEIEILESEKFAEDSLVDSQVEDGLSDNGALSEEEQDIKETK